MDEVYYKCSEHWNADHSLLTLEVRAFIEDVCIVRSVKVISREFVVESFHAGLAIAREFRLLEEETQRRVHELTGTKYSTQSG